MAQYCPHHKTCPFYHNWVGQTSNRRTDVIVTEGDGERFRYDCLTLMALDDPFSEGGIAIGDKLKKRLSNPDEQKFKCSHITLLNFLNASASDTQ